MQAQKDKELLKELLKLCQSGNQIKPQDMTTLEENCITLKNLNPNAINMKDNWGYTCLHRACYESDTNLQVIRLLIKHGADINAKNARGDTPLQLAIYAENTAASLYLLSKNADTNDLRADDLSSACSNINLFNASNKGPALKELVLNLKAWPKIEKKLIHAFDFKKEFKDLDKTIQERMMTFLMVVYRYKNTMGRLFCPPKPIQDKILQDYLKQDLQARSEVIFLMVNKLPTEELNRLIEASLQEKSLDNSDSTSSRKRKLELN